MPYSCFGSARLTSLFDVPLPYVFQNMSNGNSSWDMRGLQFAGFTDANDHGNFPVNTRSWSVWVPN